LGKGVYSTFLRSRSRLVFVREVPRYLVAALIFATACPDHGVSPDAEVFRSEPIRAQHDGEVAFLLGAAGILEPSPLYVAGAYGSPQRIGVPGDLIGFAWSPDGSRIAYVDSAGEGGGGSIDVVDADGSGNRTIVRSATPLSGISWSPDGRYIVYGQGIGMAPNGDNRYRLFAKPLGRGDALRLTQGPGESLQPAWSPDGTQIAYLSLSPPSSPLTASVQVLSADGTKTALTAPGGHLSGPAWSPDGDWLVVVEGTKVRLLRPDGSDDHVIYRCRAICYGASPAWSPDGSKIALTAFQGAHRNILTITPTGKRVPGPAGVPPAACCLAWQPVAA
jgi:Tol biopolymer transport system component